MFVGEHHPPRTWGQLQVADEDRECSAGGEIGGDERLEVGVARELGCLGLAGGGIAQRAAESAAEVNTDLAGVVGQGGEITVGTYSVVMDQDSQPARDRLTERGDAIGDLRGEIAAQGDVERGIGAGHAAMSPRGGRRLNGMQALQCIATRSNAVAPAVEMEGARDKVGADVLWSGEEKQLAGRFLLLVTVGASISGRAVWGGRARARKLKGWYRCSSGAAAAW